MEWVIDDSELAEIRRHLAEKVAAVYHGIALGGPGSGHFDHAGRPGEVGGSADDDSDGTTEADVTRVGITSQRSVGDPEHKTNAEVAKQAKEFEKKLAAIPTVTDVNVVPGMGVFMGSGEVTWITSYKGNGEAYKLLAQMGQQYKQDGVLIMRGGGSKDGTASPLVRFEFKGPVGAAGRERIHGVIQSVNPPGKDTILSGWTWHYSGGVTTLALACVPQWGGDPAAHLSATTAVSQLLKSSGREFTTHVDTIVTDVLENNNGPHGYATVLGVK